MIFGIRIMFGFHLTYTPMLMYFLVRILPIKPLHVRRWINITLFICIVIALIGLYVQVTNPAEFYRQIAPPDKLNAFARQGRWRMSSILANPLYLGALMAMRHLEFISI